MSECAPTRRWPSTNRPAITLLLTIAVVLVVHPLWMLHHYGGDRITRVLDDLVPVVAASLGVVLTARRACLEADGTTRIGWAILSASCAGLAGGQAIYAFYELVLGAHAPFPSLADISYVAGTTLGIPAVLVLGGRSVLTSRIRLVLDGGIVALAVLLVSWVVVLRTVWEAGGADWFSFALGVYYPVGDVVTVAIVLSTISTARRLNPALLVVGAGLICFSFSDSAYAYLTAENAYSGSNVIDVGWVAGYLLLGLASVIGRDHRTITDARLARWQIALPYVPLAFALGVVIANFTSSTPMDPLAVGLLVLLITLVFGRQLVTVIQSQSLAIRLSSTSAEREILIEQAPVGICRLDASERLLAANTGFGSTLRCSPAELVGRSFFELVHADDRKSVADAYDGLGTGVASRLALESRLVRMDGTVVHVSMLGAVVRDANGLPESFITIVEDVTDRRREIERAAQVQRQLLPRTTPDLRGYQLAGACLPARDVAGDFYDWMVADEDGLDLVVADVMGKGIGAGLVMATLRAGLRTVPTSIHPAARVQSAAETLVGSDVGLFVTLFYARLQLSTGHLSYVDAGHGYAAIWRAGGEVVHLRQRSLPVGVLDDEVFHEGEDWLRPNDTLIVYSDGLVERDDEHISLVELLSGLEPTDAATTIARHFLGTVATSPADDVTVLVLRRLAPVDSRGWPRPTDATPVPARSTRPAAAST